MSESVKLEVVKIGDNPARSLEGWEFNGHGKGDGIRVEWDHLGSRTASSSQFAQSFRNLKD